MKNVFILLFISLILYGCATAKSNFFPAVGNLPVYTGEVEIMDKLPEKYIDVGWINIVDNLTWIEMYQAAKDKARQYGANAIVYSPVNCKYKGGGTRSIVCRAIYVEHDKNKQLELD